MGFASAVLGHNGEYDLTGMQELQSSSAGYELAVRRENRGDPDQILSSNACVPQGQLEGSKALAMLAHSLGEEDPLRDHVLAQFICLQWRDKGCRKRKSNIAIYERWVKSKGGARKITGAPARAPALASEQNAVGCLPA